MAKIQLKRTLTQFWHASKEHKQDLFLSFLNPLGGLCNFVLVPFFASRALGQIFSGNPHSLESIALTAGTAIVGLTFNRIGFGALTRLNARTIATLNQRAFEHTINRGVRFHSNNVGGKLVADVLDYSNAYSNILVSSFSSLAALLSTTFIGLFVVFLQSWQLGLFMSCVVSIVIIWSYFNNKKRSNLRSTRHEAQRDLTAHLSDSIVNTQTVKTFAAEEREIRSNARLNAALKDLREKDWHAATVSGNYRMTFLLASLVALLYLIRYLSTESDINLSASFFALTYCITLFIRLFEVDTLSRMLEENFLRAAPVTAMLDEPMEVVDVVDAKELHVLNGAINMRDVTFQYADNKRNDTVFRKLHFSIQPGEKVGVVGPSGGGKTTLTKILLRFEDIKSGSIEIDGQDISGVTQQSLRQAIGYVPQEPLLFHRSILENISYGAPHAKKSDVIHAAQLAYAHDFIENLPNKYNTVVGERGVKLSGGQRQRVAIARSILKNAPILVLDEATSALDSESELLVQKSMDELMKGKTTIVIAHRLSTIQKMDRIIVLDKGKIVEEGTHRSLLKKKNGHYAKLWAHQSGGFLEE